VKDGGGCEIYDYRPIETCVWFKCAWLADPEIPDWVKPERVGAITFTTKSSNRLALVPAGKPVSEELRAWAKTYAEKNNLIVVG
jgi:hypothetical protein